MAMGTANGSRSPAVLGRIKLRAPAFDKLVEPLCLQQLVQPLIERMPRSQRQFRVRNPDVLLLLPLLIGYFEGIDSERGIASRLADSLALRRFVGIGLDEYTPDHSTISRTRRLIDLDTHRAVFGWVLSLLADRGLLQGRSGWPSTRRRDRKSTRLNSSHVKISYAVFC